MSAVLKPAAATRWRPTPTVAASMALHVLAAVSLALAPDAWPFVLALVAANHLVLAAIGLWPRSTLLGVNLTRLPEAAVRRGELALTFDDGPDPDVTPLVMALLEAHGARATFFCIAEQAARHPELCREIARRGHHVENHSSGHRATFAMHGLGGFRREIGGAQETLAALAGRRPRFFRPPAGLRNPLLDPVLHRLGLTLVSWTRRGFDTRNPDANDVAARLLAGLAAGDILLLHDGGSARTREGRPVVLEVLPRLLEAARERGLRPVTLAQAIEA